MCARMTSFDENTINESAKLQRMSPQRGFYVLDPVKDVAQTRLQKLLQAWGSSGEHGTWSGSVGHPFPACAELVSKMSSEDVFLYMGHGQNAEKLLLQKA